MVNIALVGYVTETGELKVRLPRGTPPGEVRVKIEAVETDQPPLSEERPWIDVELQEMLTFRPLAGTEIVAAGLTGGWENLDIADSVTWVDELRRRELERRWQ